MSNLQLTALKMERSGVYMLIISLFARAGESIGWPVQTSAASTMVHIVCGQASIDL